MAVSDRLPAPSNNTTLATVLSALVPGLGQFITGRRSRGALVFLVAAVLGFLINWAFSTLNIGKLQLGGLSTSWLWLPFLIFWVWNVFDARGTAVNRAPSVLPGILLAAVILYVIAWNVTDARLERLVTRFSDAQLVMRELINPDIATTYVNGQEQICSWGCVFQNTANRLSGKPNQPVKVSENVLDIFGRVQDKPAARWKVALGLAETGAEVRTFIPGKMIETVAIGLMATLFSTIMAIPLSFLAAHNIMSRIRFPFGSAIYYIFRTFFNIVRAIDTVVWGLIVVVWVGLGSFAGVIALTIHSVAALGKLYSEEIEHIDPGPVEALTATGANLIQVIRYGVVPQIIPPFLAYTLLRWDINMRSATVIGFVAGGGIGFFVLETIRAGGYQQYAAALWAVAVVIILVDYISAKWRERILRDQPRETVKSSRIARITRIIYMIVGVISFVYFWNVSKIDLAEMFNPGKTFGRLVLDFLKFDLSPAVVNVVFKEMLVTIFQAMLATTFGALLALPASFLAARNLTGKNPVLAVLYYATRAIFNVLRSIEALLYVAIFVFWVGIGPFAGTMALAVTTFALIGKLFSEAIENIDSGPIEAVTATGANRLQVISYAVLPQIVPPFVSYLIYQWDINIRMATIIGFAGGGGIGLTLSTFFNSLQYHKAGTVVLFIVVVVALMDFASARLREKLV